MPSALLKSIVYDGYREPESKQMLDSLGQAWQKWQHVGCLTPGRASVNKHRLYRSPLGLNDQYRQILRLNFIFSDVIKATLWMNME